MKKISQRQARKLLARVRELESILDKQRNRWSGEWPEGVYLGSLNVAPEWLKGRIDAARLLNHAVVAATRDSDHTSIRFYGLELPHDRR